MHWDYEGKKEEEISVKKGDTVTMVTGSTDKFRVKYFCSIQLWVRFVLGKQYYNIMPQVNFCRPGDNDHA